MKSFNVPFRWGASSQQEFVIGSLMDSPGKYISSAEFCKGLYGEENGKGPAPAKLRVLIQRCRDILELRTRGRVGIAIKRNSGWKITRKQAHLLTKIVESNS